MHGNHVANTVVVYFKGALICSASGGHGSVLTSCFSKQEMPRYKLAALWARATLALALGLPIALKYAGIKLLSKITADKQAWVHHCLHEDPPALARYVQHDKEPQIHTMLILDVWHTKILWPLPIRVFTPLLRVFTALLRVFTPLAFLEKMALDAKRPLLVSASNTEWKAQEHSLGFYRSQGSQLAP